ncbi:Uracil phosphoribosyltransferase [Rasamsonia emersonii CBS 393.64]|uniref:Uracil phosphoribosyltransferase n=1 Tax=Rasamsonia emersonii (strain ATCC 16479 / CBS 393.64 / IMI 116815) TaxID=1408163 RepID=A0A0F4Z1Q9_RASE3|nr:Uracil phosphoribosyltransferase [Rasamsonia emersonii CBS 393.64]KKA24036.1 Uracil phosphoribosyltransferase [Rasamsonia emersonii CBS 393.64]
MAPDPLPANIHVSTHPCLRAKLSQLRSQSTTSSQEIKSLVHDIAAILGCEALAAGLRTLPSGTTEKKRNKKIGRRKEIMFGWHTTGQDPLDVDYTTEAVEPSNIALIPVLRSGLGMVVALQTLLPFSVPVHHLGLFRERITLQPVEYYNKLPYEPACPSSSDLTALSATAPAPVSTNTAVNKAAATLAILLDPVIATGGSAAAAT